MAPPFDLSWTPTLENKLSTQIDGQLPDFIAEDHPIFSQFLKSYYQFLESGELQLTVNIDNILIEVETDNALLNEDGTLIVTEVGSGSTGKFIEGEIITGGTSYATAKVLVEDLGNETPRMFISSQQLFETGETVTGGTSGASGVVTKYRANPVQNIQQMLAYADIDNTIYDFIEEFRKSFMAGIPTNLANKVNKRTLEKHIGELYRRKGTKEGAKLFMKILLDEDAEVFYPNQYMLKSSAADWDNPTVVRCSSVGDVVADELIGQSITGTDSDATALVENSTTFSVSGGISYIEFQISNVVGSFISGENIYGISGTRDVKYNFTITDIISSVTISNDGTLYQTGDLIDLDTSAAVGSGDISATVGDVETGSISGVAIDDGGTNYEIGDLVVFRDNELEAGLVKEAEAEVVVVNGNIVDETDGDIIIQEEGTNTFITQFNFQLEDGTVFNEEPYVILGTDRKYSDVSGYYYPIYKTNYAAEQSIIKKSSASVNGATFNSTTVSLDGNVGEDITIGMVVRSNSIPVNTTVTVTSVTDQSTILLSTPQTFLDNDVVEFQSLSTGVRQYSFLEYPGEIFYSPKTLTAVAQSTYNSETYTLYGGNYNHRADHLYGESGNAASYTSGINTEAVLGDRFETELATNTIVIDTNRYDNEGFILESGAGDITKIQVTNSGEGYALLPTVTVRSQYGANTKVYATTTDIGKISSVNVTNPGFNYTEEPTLEFRGNFVVKDITGVFTPGAALTSHTGTVRSFDSATQLLEVSIEDTVGIQGESFGEGSYNEGVLLEDSLATSEYVNENIILNANLVYGENLVAEDGDRLLIDSTSITSGFINLEDGFGQIIMEHPEVEELAQTILEDGSGSLRSEPDTYGHDDDNIMGEFICQEIGFRNDDAVYTYDQRQVKFLLENSTVPPLKSNDNAFIVLDSDIEYEDNLVLNATDTLGANSGDKIIPNSTDANGVGDPTNNIVLESGITDSVNEKLLYENDDPFTNLLLDGTNADTLHINEKVLFEDTGIDFSAGTTSISTVDGSATIVHADIAKAKFSLGTSAEKTGTFGGIENLIGEALIRIQDSYYYQDFSYEIQSSSGGSSYLNELKKSIHPAGFNVFSKAITTSFVSAKLQIGEAQEIGESDRDGAIFDAILSTTFFSIFAAPIERRLGFTTEEETVLLLETSIQETSDDQFEIEEELGVGVIRLETPENAYIDFEAIEISYGIGAGEFGLLLTEDLDRIVSESAEAISNNLVLDGTEDGHLQTSQGDAGFNIITEDDLSFELEDSLQDGISFLSGEDSTIIDNLLSEVESDIFVIEGISDYDRDVHVRSSYTTHVDVTLNKTHNTANGLSFLATKTYEGISGDGIALESGSSQLGSRLLLTQTDSSASDLGDHILLESGSDVNINQSVTKDTYTSLGYSTNNFTRDSLVNISNENSFDGIILEGQEIGTFKLEDGSTVTGTFGDDILLEDSTGFGVGEKLRLERTFIALEDSINVGANPFDMAGDTILEPFTIPSDIFVSSRGTISSEDIDNLLIDHSGNTELILESGGNILLESSLDDTGNISGHITLESDDESTGFEFLLEDGTDLDLYARTTVLEFGFDGILTTFDNNLASFDVEQV